MSLDVLSDVKLISLPVPNSPNILEESRVGNFLASAIGFY